MKNEVLIRSSHKLRFKRHKCIHSIEQPLISLDLKDFMIQLKLGYLKSILQSRSSLLPSYCIKCHLFRSGDELLARRGDLDLLRERRPRRRGEGDRRRVSRTLVIEVRGGGGAASGGTNPPGTYGNRNKGFGCGFGPIGK